MSEQDCNMEEDLRADEGLVEKIRSSRECDENLSHEKETSSDSDQLETSKAKKTKLSDSPIEEGNRFAEKTDFRETNLSLMEINEEEENHDLEDCVLAELEKVGSCFSSISSTIRVEEKIVSNEEDNRFSEKTVSRETSMSLMENKDQNEENHEGCNMKGLQEKGSCSVEVIMANVDNNEEGNQEIEFDLNVPCPEVREECKYKSRVEELHMVGIHTNEEGNQEIDVDLNLPCEVKDTYSRVEELYMAGIHNNEEGNQEIDVDLNFPCEVKYTSRVEELYIDGETKEVVFIDIEDSDHEGNQCDQEKELKNKSERETEEYKSNGGIGIGLGEIEKDPYGERDGFINNEKKGYSREEEGKGKVGEDWLTMSLAIGGSLDDHFDKGK